MIKKQDSLSTDKLKSVLITRTAIKTLIDESIVEKVIMFQFKDVKESFHNHEQVEISGFGKFMTSPSKIAKKIINLDDTVAAIEKKLKERVEDTPAARLETWRKMLEGVKIALGEMKTKKGGYVYKP